MSWSLLRKMVFACILIGIVALVFQDGDFSSKAGGYIQDRLQELGSTL